MIEIADMTATHEAGWAGYAASGRKVRLSIVIYFPWAPEAQKFGGEQIHFDRLELKEQLTHGPVS